MLPRPHRVPAELAADIAARGNASHSPSLSLRYVMSGADAPKLGVAVSAKVSASAVSRNSIKRRIRAAMRASVAPLPKGFAGMIHAKRGGKLDDISALRAEIQDLLAAATRRRRMSQS